MDKWFDQRRIGALVAVFLVLGFGVYFVQQSQEKKDQEGRSAIYKVMKTLEEEEKAISDAEKIPGAPVDVDARFSKTVAELKGLLAAKSGNNRVLFDAAMKLGSLYLDHGLAEKAIPGFQSATGFAKTDLQKSASGYLLAVSFEESSKWKDSVQAYESALKNGPDGLKAEILFALVRNELKLNEKEKAVAFSDRLKKEHSGTKAADAADALMKEAR
jgi:TolA-binding protein